MCPVPMVTGFEILNDHKSKTQREIFYKSHKNINYINNQLAYRQDV